MAEVDESESLQLLFANGHGHIGFRPCWCDIRNRQAHASVYRGCQKCVDVALIRTAHYDGHARDLSAVVDLVSHDCEEVGIGRKQRVNVGYYVVLPDESMGPVVVGVHSASHHVALVIVTAGNGGGISRQSLEVCEYAVLPNCGIEG